MTAKRYIACMDPKGYRYDSTMRTYREMRSRKTQLKEQGYRVKYRKNTDGFFDLYAKDVRLIEAQRGQGNGRVHA